MDIESLRKLAQAATPGPWEVGQYGNSFIVTAKERMYDVAVVRNIGNEDNEANARLMATFSPEQILRLLDVVQTAKSVSYSNGFDAAYPDKLASLRASLEALGSAAGVDVPGEGGGMSRLRDNDTATMKLLQEEMESLNARWKEARPYSQEVANLDASFKAWERRVGSAVQAGLFERILAAGVDVPQGQENGNG